jgi:carboxymethylenebutenolidase
MAGSFLLWVARRGVFTTWVAAFAAVAVLLPSTARASETGAGRSRMPPVLPGVTQITHAPEPVQYIFQLAALAAGGLLAAHAARVVTGRPGSGRRVTAALATLTLLGAPAFAGGDKAGPEPKPEMRHFTSGGKEVAVECFAPTSGGQHPAVVVLHAVDGIDGDCARRYRGLAQDYAARGYVFLLVHYYDRTGAAKTDLQGYRDLFVGYYQRREHKAEDLRRMRALLGEWAEVVRDAVAYARGRPDVDGQRVGLVGFSMGATVALAAATRYDLKLAALAEFFGTLPQEPRPDPKKLPPTLVIHGEEDTVVPVEQAYLLVGLLAVRQRAYEAEVYPGVGHMFSRDGKETQWAPLLAAQRRTNDFLGKHLKPAAIAVTAQ